MYNTCTTSVDWRKLTIPAIVHVHKSIAHTLLTTHITTCIDDAGFIVFHLQLVY